MSEVLLKTQLKERGLRLNPPLDETSDNWKQVFDAFPSTRHIRQVYNWFDGFEANDFDAMSCMCLWPICTINEERLSAFSGQLVVGDFLIHSDFIVVGDNGTLCLLYEKRFLANSLEEFLKDLCDDRFNF